MDTNLDGSQDTTASGGPQEDMSEPPEMTLTNQRARMIILRHLVMRK